MGAHEASAKEEAENRQAQLEFLTCFKNELGLSAEQMASYVTAKEHGRPDKLIQITGECRRWQLRVIFSPSADWGMTPVPRLFKWHSEWSPYDSFHCLYLIVQLVFALSDIAFSVWRGQNSLAPGGVGHSLT